MSERIVNWLNGLLKETQTDEKQKAEEAAFVGSFVKFLLRTEKFYVNNIARDKKEVILKLARNICDAKVARELFSRFQTRIREGVLKIKQRVICPNKYFLSMIFNNEPRTATCTLWNGTLKVEKIAEIAESKELKEPNNVEDDWSSDREKVESWLKKSVNLSHAYGVLSKVDIENAMSEFAAALSKMQRFYVKGQIHTKSTLLKKIEEKLSRARIVTNLLDKLFGVIIRREPLHPMKYFFSMIYNA